MEESVVGGLPSMDYEEVTPTSFIESDFVGMLHNYIHISSIFTTTNGFNQIYVTYVEFFHYIHSFVQITDKFLLVYTIDLERAT